MELSPEGTAESSQDEILGGSGKTRAVPEGRLRWEGRSPVYPQPFFTGQYSQDFILGSHQPSLRGLKSCALHYPALDVLGYFQSSLRDCCMIAPDPVFVLIVDLGTCFRSLVPHQSFQQATYRNNLVSA